MTQRTSHLLLLALIVIGLAIRLTYLDVPPVSFHPTRQYRAALIARGESAAALATLTADQRGAAFMMRSAQTRIEPEIMEGIAAWLYDGIGHEDLRAPRLVSILAWLLGGLSVVWMLRLGGVAWVPTLLAFGCVVLLPYGVDASRAFMPDPLMVGLTMAALAVSVWHYTRPTVPSAVVRIGVAAAAVFVKPMAVFFLAPAILALDVSRFGLLRGLVSATVTSLCVAAPTAWYYVTLMASGNPIANDRFFTQLWTRSTYWLGWLEMVRRVIGWPALALSLLGLVLPARGALRPLRVALAAAWVGYIAMGLLFTHHISTHDYYSLPMLPIAAASIALALASLTGRPSSEPGLTASEPGGFRPRVLALAFVALILAGVYPSLSLQGYYGDVDAARQTAADYERIGTLTRHSTRVVSLDGAYGYPLSYHALIGTSQLPLSIDRDINQLVGRSDAEITADFTNRQGEFFVGTLQSQLDIQPNLRALLDQRHLLMEIGGSTDAWRFIVYDLTRVRLNASPESFSVFTRVGGGDESATVKIIAPPGVTWRAVSADPARIRLEPASGVGDTEVQVIGTPAAAAGANAEGTVEVSLFSDGSGTEPGGKFTVHWRTQAAGPNTPPFGYVDAPADPVMLTGDAPVVFQGWALDDVRLVKIDVVLRDAGGDVVIGQATREGKRPDVAAAHPTAHDLQRPAWHFVLTRAQLTSLAPRFGTGQTFTVVFRGVDANGAAGVLGQRTIRR